MKGNFVRRGFTLIELILVVALLGALAVAALPSFFSSTDRANENVALSVKAAVRGGINLYLAQQSVNGNQASMFPFYLDDTNFASGPCTSSTPCFSNVLETGITDSRWQKNSLTEYKYTYGDTTVFFTFDPFNGDFLQIDGVTGIPF